MNVAYFVVQQTMYFAIPLLIVAIGAMYSERSGVINIALEGIMVMGAFAGIFFINILGDIKWSGIVPARHAGSGTDRRTVQSSACICFDQYESRSDHQRYGAEPLCTGFCDFYSTYDPGMQQIQFTDTFHINKVPVLGDIPVIGDLFFQNCYISTYIGILIFAVAAFVIKNTRFGLRLRACGEHPGAADSVGVNVYKIRYAGVIISGVLGGIGGLIFVVPTSTNFNASVAGYGFLAIAVLIFGQWRSNKILMAAFFFGIMKTLSSAYSTIPFLKSLPIPNEVYKMIPYIATLVVLAFFSKNSQAPKAEGIPYDKGSR